MTLGLHETQLRINRAIYARQKLRINIPNKIIVIKSSKIQLKGFYYAKKLKMNGNFVNIIWLPICTVINSLEK